MKKALSEKKFLKQEHNLKTCKTFWLKKVMIKKMFKKQLKMKSKDINTFYLKE